MRDALQTRGYLIRTDQNGKMSHPYPKTMDQSLLYRLPIRISVSNLFFGKKVFLRRNNRCRKTALEAGSLVSVTEINCPGLQTATRKLV